MLKWLKNLSQRLSSKRSSERPLQRRVIPRDQHPISRKQISRAALDVLYTLQKAGYEAYLVGGGVRDLLLGGRPKDFDVATDARPEEVRQLFRRARIIGRRFRIVHVMFGPETIEVTTFRAGHEPDEREEDDDSAANGESAVTSSSGMLLRDNVYGSVEEDAIRRDFTVNALYYTTKDFTLHDFAGGLEDLERRLIRVIGDPERRYREDPVRMLRAVRFAAKLDFQLEKQTAAPLKTLASQLFHVPPARMFDEVLKLLMAGHGVRTFELLREYGLFAALFPDTDRLLREGDQRAEILIREALQNTDARLAEGKSVTPAFLYAAMLWPPVRALWEQLEADAGLPSLVALQRASQQVLNEQLRHTALPKRFSAPMREIWDLQLRLPRRHGARALELLEHPRFRAAYDFLLLRERAGESTGGIGQWWTDFQAADDRSREQLQRQLSSVTSGGGAARRRRPRRRRGPARPE